VPRRGATRPQRNRQLGGGCDPWAGMQSRCSRFGTKGSQVQILSPRHSKYLTAQEFFTDSWAVSFMSPAVSRFRSWMAADLAAGERCMYLCVVVGFW